MEENLQDSDKKIKPLVFVVSALALLLIVAALYFAFFDKSNSKEAAKTDDFKQEQATSSSETSETTDATMEGIKNLETQVKSPHFVSSTPAHGSVLDSTVSELTINFNFDLGTGSKIEVIVDGNDLVVQPAKISADKLSMTANFNPVQSAIYTVNYTACWPDGSCHEGSFSFSVK